jgi:thymidine kinase
MQYFDGNSGFITVIAGPMFSEKSGELIKRCEKMQKYGRKTVKAYKPNNDNRFSEDEIVSRTGYRLPATNIPTEISEEVMEQILTETKDIDVIAFDEAQFFSKNIMRLVDELAYRKKQVIIAGLNMDYRGKEFGFMGGLMVMSDEPVKLTAYCSCCGNPMATHSQRLTNGKPAKLGAIVLIGDTESYEPRCRNCFVPPHKVKEAKKTEELSYTR